MRTSYYIDTCIWLNLFKKENGFGSTQPHWKIAQEFIQKLFSKDNEIIYSGFVIKELEYKMDELNICRDKLLFLKSGTAFKFIKATNEDYLFARKLEKRYKERLSFYDYLHIALCKRMCATLVTRDYEMIKVAEEYISAGRPEHLL